MVKWHSAMKGQQSLSGFVCLPENRSGFEAVRELADALIHGNTAAVSLLFLHGPPGSGKSHLLAGMVHEVGCRTALSVLSLLGSEPGLPSDSLDLLEQARLVDLLLVDDLHHLPVFWSESLVQLIDHRLARQRPTVFASRHAPPRLVRRDDGFPARLTSRLTSGLVVSFTPLQRTSRLLFLQELGRRMGLVIPADIYAWVAENVTGGPRQLEGATRNLEALAKKHPLDLDVALVARQYRTQIEATRPTIERIVQKVSGYFGVKARDLQSDSRFRGVLMPRQVGMYLARRLTRLSLDKIGAYFGDRDHSTVLHACRKVERALTSDPGLVGAVQQLQAELA